MQKAPWIQNFLLLGGETLLQFDEYGQMGVFGRSMFQSSNERLLLVLLHFLLEQLPSTASTVSRNWPFHDRRQQSEFKRAVQEALQGLVRQGDLTAEVARTSVLSTARSPSAEMLLWRVSTVVLKYKFPSQTASLGIRPSMDPASFGAGAPPTSLLIKSYRARTLAEVESVADLMDILAATESIWQKQALCQEMAIRSCRQQQVAVADGERELYLREAHLFSQSAQLGRTRTLQTVDSQLQSIQNFANSDEFHQLRSEAGHGERLAMHGTVNAAAGHKAFGTMMEKLEKPAASRSKHSQSQACLASLQQIRRQCEITENGLMSLEWLVEREIKALNDKIKALQGARGTLALPTNELVPPTPGMAATRLSELSSTIQKRWKGQTRNENSNRSDLPKRLFGPTNKDHSTFRTQATTRNPFFELS